MRRALTVGLLSGAFILALAPAAGAHALVRRSDPANGAVLRTSPAQVVITFTESPDPKLSFIHVVNAAGQDVGKAPSGPVPGAPLQLQVVLRPSLPDGVYTITWRTVSRVDGHVTGGSLTFGVGVTPTKEGSTSVIVPTTPSPPPLSVIGRWMFYWGLAVLLGAAAFGLLVRDGLAAGGRFLLGAAWALAAGGLVAMILSESSTVGVPVARLLGTSTGSHFIDRAMALGVLGVATLGYAIRPGRLVLAAQGAAAAGAMLIHVRAGHAGVSGSFSGFNVAVQWFHVLAVGVWIGGLVWLLLGLRTLRGPERAGMARRFSWMAGWALGLVAVTGLSRALDEVGWPGHWNRLFDTSFGITVLIKVGLFGALVSLGALNRYRNVPRVDTPNPGIGPLRLTVRAEVAIAALILAATAVLSELPPSATVAAAAAKPKPPEGLVLVGTDFATTVRVRLTVTPGMVGPNRFAARVEDFDTGRAAPARSVALTFSLPSQPNIGTPTLPLEQQAAGLWTARSTILSMYGTWDLEVLVQEAQQAVTVPLRLTPRLPPENITVAAASGQPTLYTIALSGRDSLQAYVDPGAAGNNTVHFTFFQPSGDELPISSATALSVPPGGPAQPMPLIRFDAGHFVANTSLSSGRWRFVISAVTKEGTVFTAYFDQTIPT